MREQIITYELLVVYANKVFLSKLFRNVLWFDSIEMSYICLSFDSK